MGFNFNIHNYELERAVYHPSDWIVSILYSQKDVDDKRIVNVIYRDKKAKIPKLYSVWFYVADWMLQDLLEAESVGSEYWWKWSIYGGTPKQRYFGDELEFESEGTPDTPVAENKSKSFGMTKEHYEKLMEGIGSDNYNETLQEISDDINRTPDEIEQFLDAMKRAKEMYQASNSLMENILAGNLTKMETMSNIIRDIQGLFGVDFRKDIFYNLIDGAGFGKLNPKSWIRLKHQIKNAYELVEKEGIKGLGKIGRRIASAKNPLVRNRETYLAKEVVKKATKRKRKLKGYSEIIDGKRVRVYEGEEAVGQVRRYVKRLQEAEAKGFYDANKAHLVKEVIGKGGKSKVIYRWKKDVKRGRKFIALSKRVLKIARFIK